MELRIVNKTLILGIIILFVGASILPSTLGEKEKFIVYNKQSTFFVDPPDEDWNNTFGGIYLEGGQEIKQTSDGGYIIAGYTNSYGAGYTDAWLLKLDSSGNYEWDSTFGGSDEDGAQSVYQTTEGSYIITGRTKSYGAGMYDLWLIKADGNGNHLWNKTFGSTGEDGGYSVIETSDGGYVVTGRRISVSSGTEWDVWLIKTDTRGDLIWDHTYGAEGSDGGYSVVQAEDGGYIIAGFTTSYGAGWHDFWLIKTDSLGNLQWHKTFGEAGHDVARSVSQTQPDTGYILTGNTWSSDTSSYDLCLIKTDLDGNEIWNKTFGGNNDDFGFSVIQASDGGYIATGSTILAGNEDEALWIVKTFDSGNLNWDIIYDGYDYDSGRSIVQTSDEGYIISGDTYSYGSGGSDAWVIKLKKENQPPNPPTIDGPTSGSPDTEYSYTIVANEPDADEIYYYIDWDDGEIEDWFGPLGSCVPQTISHTWAEEGNYIIKAKAKDISDAESDWSEFEVEIPRNKAFFNSYLQRFLELFPNIFSLIRRILILN
jgi:hypothetical protein